jgi:hypothetical protein
MPKKRVIYTGALAKRSTLKTPVPSKFTVVGKPVPTKDQPPEFQKALRAVSRHQVRGIPLLLKHYKIDPAPDMEPHEWLMMLVLRLARDHVPYFQGPRGVKRADTPGNIRLIRGDVPTRMVSEDTLKQRRKRARKDPWVKLWLKADPQRQQEIEQDIFELWDK